MRAIIVAAIATAAGVMVYFWFQPVCEGGTVVADEAMCASAPGFDAGFCRQAFARAAAIAKVSGASYPSLWECNRSWPKCLQRGASGEAVPAPSGWCIVRGQDGAIGRLAPQYDNRRQ